MTRQLAGIQGRFVLSINDTPAVREVFGRFAMEAVGVTYTIGAAIAGAGQRAGELIVTGTVGDPLPSITKPSDAPV